MATPMIDLAVSLLAGWQGIGPSWYADTFERGTEADPQYPVASDSLAIARRGRVADPAMKGHARQFRRWRWAPKIVSMPYNRMAKDAAMALADMRMGRAAENLLILYACEDFSRWPMVRAFLLTRWHGRPELVPHAMCAVMYQAKRTRESPGELAKLVRMRKADYLRERRQLEALILDHLEQVAAEFVRAHHGNPRFPENSLISRMTNELPLAA